MPRWILPLVVLSDLLVLGVLYAVLGWPGLLFGVPVLVGTVIALVVLRLVTAPHRRLLADLRAVGVGGPGRYRHGSPGPYRHGSPGGTEDPFWGWPSDRPTGADDSCDDRDHRHGVDHSCGGSWTSEPGWGGPEPSWSGSGADSAWSGADSSSGSSSDSSSNSSSDSGSSSSSSSSD